MNAMLDPAARVLASKRAMRQAARERAAMAIAGTPGGAAEARETRTQETMRAGVREVYMADEDILSAMGLTLLQRDAAAYLRGLWADCLPGCELPGGYGSGAGHGGRRHLTHDQHLAASRAWQDYQKAMARLSEPLGEAVRDAVLRGVPRHPPHVRDGLDVLAGHWGMR
jgi:hypothetical protein